MSENSTTEDWAESLDNPETGRRVKLPEKLSLLRQKLGRKAKQEGCITCRFLCMPKARVSGKAQCGKSAGCV